MIHEGPAFVSLGGSKVMTHSPFQAVAAVNFREIKKGEELTISSQAPPLTPAIALDAAIVRSAVPALSVESGTSVVVPAPGTAPATGETPAVVIAPGSGVLARGAESAPAVAAASSKAAVSATPQAALAADARVAVPSVV